MEQEFFKKLSKLLRETRYEFSIFRLNAGEHRYNRIKKDMSEYIAVSDQAKQSVLNRGETLKEDTIIIQNYEFTYLVDKYPITNKFENMKQKLEIPQGYEFEKVEEGKVILKKIEPRFPTKITELDSEGLFFIDYESSITKFNKEKSDNRYDRNLCDTKEEAEAFLALMQLKRFCNAWNKIDEFVPDFTDESTLNFGVGAERGQVAVMKFYRINLPLCFKNIRRAEQFMETFKELLETAKPLL